MAVIPNGQGAEKVIVWDKEEGNQLVLGAGQPFNGGWPQRFAVGDPETNTWSNYVWTIPTQNGEHLGDLFCSGHVWLPDGRLFVAGGNAVYGNVALPPSLPISVPGLPGVPSPILPNRYYGSKIAAIWDPRPQFRNPANNFGWTLLPNMQVRRWYPTVTLLANDTVMISGGSEISPNSFCAGGPDPAFNTYEVWRIDNPTPPGSWEPLPTGAAAIYNGPSFFGPCNTVLGEYPRMHLLASNRVFVSGMFAGANRVWHDRSYVPATPAFPPAIANWDSNPAPSFPPTPPTPGWPTFTSGFRDYGASVVLPNIGRPGFSDVVMVLGGRVVIGGQVIATLQTEVIQASRTSPSWAAGPAMNRPRHMPNPVLMPNGEIIVVGGAENGFFPMVNPSRAAEIWNGLSWRVDAAQLSERGYHATAALLPNGKVVSAGSDQRTSDYETYTPAYLNAPPGQRPQFAGSFANPANTVLSWDTDYQIEHAPFTSSARIQRVVLMRPCSTTHNTDMDQRYLELPILSPPQQGGIGGVQGDWVWVHTPRLPVTGVLNSFVEALRGWYMMFLVSDQGFVSDGKWVRLP